MISSVDVLTNIVINSLLIIGFHVSTWPDMINFWFARWGNLHFPASMQKPLYDCVTCMSSIYGVGYCLGFTNYISDIQYLILHIVCLSGFNFVINVLVVDKVRKEFEKEYTIK